MFRRVWLLVAIAATVVGVPLLFPEAPEPVAPMLVSSVATTGVPRPGDQEDATDVGEATPDTSAPSPTTTEPVAPTTTVPPTTTTTVPPTTTTVPPTTTTTEAPAPAPAPAPSPGAGRQEGEASWYELAGAPGAGVCAHRSLPFGTVVTVTNLKTGRSISCTVGDRGPYAGGYIVDLYRDDFAQLAPLGAGVIPVRLEW
ncbi:MAG: septal ring lytic transglycosylase RlpA family protein [Acidimicrobiales bacterium]